MTMLDPKAMDTAREAWIASDVATRFFSDVEEHALQAAITAYISTITPAEVGGLVERLRALDAAILSTAPGEAATALEAQAAELAALREADGNFWEAIARAERAEAALAEARKALEPFAAFAEEMDTDPNGYPWKDTDHILKGITAGNFRAAHRALTGGQEDA